MALTVEQAELALSHGWSKDVLLKLRDWMAYIEADTLHSPVITHQNRHFMVIDGQFHVYKTLGLRPLFENRGLMEATGYGDGSGTNSRNAGGIGVVIESPNWKEPKLIHHNIGSASNNACELTAIWRILMEIPHNLSKIIVRSDSTYSLGIVANLDWKIKANPELVQAIRNDLAFRPYVTFQHVRGHDGNYYQEMADALAGVARKYAPQTLFFE